MKRLLLILAALVGLGAAGLAFAQGVGPDGSGIVGSPHDFTDGYCFEPSSYAPGDAPGDKTYGLACDEAATGFNDSKQLCKVCHTPHDPEAAEDIGALLWNHDDSAATAWTMYDSASMDATVTTTAPPTGLSMACLGCHDGIQGVDMFGTHTGATEKIGSAGLWAGATELLYGIKTGTEIDASTNHPISVEYIDSAGTDMFTKATTNMDNGLAIEKRLEEITGKFYVQCHSCHDVHNNSTNDQWLLRLPVQDLGDGGDSEASALCLACHDK